MTNHVLRVFPVVLTLMSGAAFAQDVAVTACGQEISGQAGYLTGNLDCTGYGNDAIVIVDGSLDLRGFTLTGGDLAGVRCESRCDIFSVPAGGTITGAGYNGIDVGTYLVPNTDAVLTDIVVTANGSLPHYQIGAFGPDSGISVWGSVELNNVTVSNTVGDGVVGRRIVLNGSRVNDNRGNGVNGLSVLAVDSTFSGNGGAGVGGDSVTLEGSLVEYNSDDYPYQNGDWGPDGVEIGYGTLKMTGTTVRFNARNGVALYYSGATITDSSIVDNGTQSPSAGIYGTGAKVKVSGSEIRRNAYGIDADFGVKVNVKDSVISNNGTGIQAFGQNKLKLSGSEISSNTSYGVRGIDYVLNGNKLFPTKLGVKSSIFSANGVFDISTQQPPKFLYEAGINDCVHSERNAPGTRPHWGICSLDCTNGVLNPGEVCDTAGESVTCDDDCTVPGCGDANLNETVGEECDDGGVTPGDGCDAVCVKEFCGDGIAQAGIGETCDTGGGFAMNCDDDCTAVVCGDDTRNPKAGEQCDDGNMNNGDGCSATCQKE